MAFTDNPDKVEDTGLGLDSAYLHTSRQTRSCNMQQTSGDYPTHWVTEAAGDMTVRRPTQSGVDPQSQDPDDVTPVPPIGIPIYPPL